MNRTELLKFHEEFCDRAREIMRAKNADYSGAGGDQPFANFQRSESLGFCSTEASILVRLADKISRLSTFTASGQLMVKDESVEDTCIDAANYFILFAAYLRSKKQAETPKNLPHISV